MNLRNKATRIRLADFSSAPMRAFHMSWIAFFLCFFGWFGIAPLMPVIRQELHLSKAQIGNLTIASVAITVLVRLLIGWLCDRIGPRRAYTWLLILGSLPVMAVGLAHDYTTFLLFRLAIGAIGASFVITQYHTSVMFAPNVVGTANAAAAGWGNLGGGVTQMVMPLLFAGFVSLGAGAWWGWRHGDVRAGSHDVPGRDRLLQADAGHGRRRLRGASRQGRIRPDSPAQARAFATACRDPRVWALFVIYGACFGMELTIDNIAALYFTDNFHLALTAAGVGGGLVRHDEPVCPRFGRHRERPLPQALGTARPRPAAGSNDLRRRTRADAVLADARAAFGHRRDDVDRPVHQDVERRDIFAGSVRE